MSDKGKTFEDTFTTEVLMKIFSEEYSTIDSSSKEDYSSTFTFPSNSHSGVRTLNTCKKEEDSTITK